MSRPVTLRSITVEDLAAILEDLDDFWGEDRDMGFLHQALYVHEFGETSVLAERDSRILGYLLGFVGQDETGYIHAVAVRGEARNGGLARRMYERFTEIVSERDAYRLKAITAPENAGSRAFHEAVGFAVAEVDGYSPSAGERLVFTKALSEPVPGADSEFDLGGGASMRPLGVEDIDELHATIEANRAHLARWLPFPGQPLRRTADHVRRCVRHLAAGRSVSMAILEEGHIVGSIGFVEPSRAHDTTQIGYWLAEQAEGRGLMTRAAALMTEEAFDRWGFGRVEIHVAAGNARSLAIPERLGFRREALLRDGHVVGGVKHDETIYGLLASDPRPWRG